MKKEGQHDTLDYEELEPGARTKGDKAESVKLEDLSERGSLSGRRKTEDEVWFDAVDEQEVVAGDTVEESGKTLSKKVVTSAKTAAKEQRHAALDGEGVEAGVGTVEEFREGSSEALGTSANTVAKEEEQQGFFRKLGGKVVNFAKRVIGSSTTEATTEATVKEEPRVKAPMIKEEPTIKEDTVKAPTVKEEPRVKAPTVKEEPTIKEDTVKEATVKAPTVKEDTGKEAEGSKSTGFMKLIGTISVTSMVVFASGGTVAVAVGCSAVASLCVAAKDKDTRQALATGPEALGLERKKAENLVQDAGNIACAAVAITVGSSLGGVVGSGGAVIGAMVAAKLAHEHDENAKAGLQKIGKSAVSLVTSDIGRKIIGTAIVGLGVTGAIVLSGATFGIAPAACLAVAGVSTLVGVGYARGWDKDIAAGFVKTKESFSNGLKAVKGIFSKEHREQSVAQSAATTSQKQPKQAGAQNPAQASPKKEHIAEAKLSLGESGQGLFANADASVKPTPAKASKDRGSGIKI